MKHLKMLYVCIGLLAFMSCSEDLKEDKNLSRSEVVGFEKTVLSTESYFEVPFGFSPRAYFAKDLRFRKEIPATVVYTMSQLFPNHKISDFKSKIAKQKSDRMIYVLTMNHNLDLIVFENGYPFGASTVETETSANEKTAFDLSWRQYLALGQGYSSEFMEEIVTLKKGAVTIDFKNDSRIEITNSGLVKSLGKDDKDDDQKAHIDPANLPQIVLDYVAANYPDETITAAEEDASGFEVFLSNGLKLEFDINGNFLEISGENEGLGEDINPASLPQAILDYIVSNYPEATIVEAEQYPNQFEVTLSNGLQLEFDLAGNFIEFSGGGNDGNDDNDVVIDPSTLPQTILDYLATNYPGETIVKAEVDLTEYEVTLSNGLKLEFDLDGNFIEISGNDNNDGEEDGNDISPNTLPQAILDYIATNYPETTIVEAEQYPTEYEVTLSNGLKLEFDLNGNFLEISGSENDDNDDNSQHIDPSTLPQSILDYIASNYPGTTIVKAEVDATEYEVTLSNGLKIEFDLNGNFIEISGNDGDNDGEGQHINPSTLPQNILDYVAANYPDASIVEAEQYPNGFEVELDNGLELEFDLDGNFIEISGGCNDIPLSQLPQVIQDWVSTNYPNVDYEEIERCPTEYEIELDNDVKITFDLEGNVIEIDD